MAVCKYARPSVFSSVRTIDIELSPHHVITADRSVLAAGSEVYRVMLSADGDYRETALKRLRTVDMGVSGEAFEAFVHYLYGCRNCPIFARLDAHGCVDLLDLAKRHFVPTLADFVMDTLVANLMEQPAAGDPGSIPVSGSGVAGHDSASLLTGYDASLDFEPPSGSDVSSAETRFGEKRALAESSSADCGGEKTSAFGLTGSQDMANLAIIDPSPVELPTDGVCGVPDLWLSSTSAGKSSPKRSMRTVVSTNKLVNVCRPSTMSASDAAVLFSLAGAVLDYPFLTEMRFNCWLVQKTLRQS